MQLSVRSFIALSLFLSVHGVITNDHFEIQDPSSIVIEGSEVREAFALSDVWLDDDTFQAKAANLNTEYLMRLDPDRLLWVFRENARLPAPGLPFTGTWESPGKPTLNF
eukprot:gene9143-16266_t